MRVKMLTVVGLVAALMLFVNSAAMGSSSANDSSIPANVHGHSLEVSESHDQPVSEKLLWGVILTSISVVIFAIGNDGYALVKAFLNGARHLWGWHGQWVSHAAYASLFIPARFRERMYLTVVEQGYTLRAKGRDEEGGGWGTLLCTSGKHPIGKWELRANHETLNLPELTLKFNNGHVQTIVFKRAT